MLQQVIIITLIITAIHVSMFDGMIFAFLRRLLAQALDTIRLPFLKKPLYECNICMGGIYTLIIYPILYGFHWSLIPVMLGVIGCSVIMAAIIKYLYNDDTANNH